MGLGERRSQPLDLLDRQRKGSLIPVSLRRSNQIATLSSMGSDPAMRGSPTAATWSEAPLGVFRRRPRHCLPRQTYKKRGGLVSHIDAVKAIIEMRCPEPRTRLSLLEVARRKLLLPMKARACNRRVCDVIFSLAPLAPVIFACQRRDLLHRLSSKKNYVSLRNLQGAPLMHLSPLGSCRRVYVF